MGYVVSVYTRDAFKEFLLPSINNADYQLTLHRSFFGLEADQHLHLEIIDGEWRLLPFDTYFIYYRKQRRDQALPLQDQEYVQLLTNYNEQISILVSSVERPLSVYGKFEISKAREITIGRGENNRIYYNNHDLIAREHAALRRDNNGWQIVPLSQNGIYVNGGFVDSARHLYFGDYINIVGLHMVFMGNVLAIDTENRNVSVQGDDLIPVRIQAEKGEKKAEEILPPSRVIFHRAPRAMDKIETEPVEIEEPPKLGKGRKQSMLMTIGPSFTMTIPMLLGCLMMVAASAQSGGGAGLYMWSGVAMTGSSAVIGVIWALVSLKEQKKQEAAAEAHRFEAFSKYLVEKTEEVKTKYEHNQEALRSLYPEAKACTEYDENNVLLWSRNTTHEDFLSHRLGIGNLPFPVNIDTPKKRFSLEEDSLAEKPRMIKENYGTMYDVPVRVDLLKQRLIGVLGGKDKLGASAIVRILSAQIAACNCYTDVKLAYIYNNEDSSDLGQYDYAKWFPHVWSEDKKIRYVASSPSEASDVFYEITKVFRQRADRGGKAGGLYRPHFVLFVSDASLIENELISRYIFDEDKNYGLTTFILSDSYEHLPNACEFIIENDDFFRGIYVTTSKEKNPIHFDEVSPRRMEYFARRLSNIEVQETENGGELPSVLTFFDMYGITSLSQLKVEERWLKNRTYDNIRGLLGQKAGGADCYLDVHEKYHGPHGLVAGTTGSGKSETLQTYMLSLALNYSPDDVGFFIIDYKGGGMANLFEGLPHMIGQISNLSGNQVHRAMVSIKSENKRRQRIFNENDVNNINAYTKLYKNGEASEPVPHLFIIIDEFAELKKEEPDFMKELISVAQVGRSLGVHLILATQKPSGTVDDNIWSNSKFRLCLRVQDRQDSNDMLHKPDAAYITQAGRGYLQVGNDEVYELFQSGWSGAPYIENSDSARTDIARVLNLTGRADAVGSHAKMARKEKELYQWVKTVAESFLVALHRQGLSMLSDAMAGRMETDELLEGVYRELARRGKDYPRSKYNSARLEEFGRLLQEVMQEEEKSTQLVHLITLSRERNIKLPQIKEKSQLDAVKEYLAQAALQYGYTHNHQLWLPVLPDHLFLEDFEEYKRDSFDGMSWQAPAGAWSLEVLMGRIDDPVNQAQVPLYLNFPDCGNIALCGSVVSGKSTFLQTLVYGLISRYTPQYVNLYLLDFSSRMMSAFEDDVHVGGVMYENDTEMIARFFNMMDKILEERKKLFRGGNYSQYVQVHGVTHPAIFLVIDNYAAFREKTQEEYEDRMITLSKEGVSHGIFLIVSGAGFGMNEISNRVGENMKTVVALEMADRYAYADILHTMQLDVLPEVGIKGRGLVNYGGRILEFQTALSLDAEDDYQRMEGIIARCAQMKQAWTGRAARKVPSIPENPVWTEFVQQEEVQALLQTQDGLPVGYDSQNADIYSIPLRSTYCYLITGGIHGGKKNFMKLMILSAREKKARVAILDSPEKKFRPMESLGGIDYVGDKDAMVEYFVNTLKPEFIARNRKKNAMVQEGIEDGQICDTMLREETPYFLFIPDLEWFLLTVYDDSNVSGFMENLFDRGALHNIYFVGNLPIDKRSSIAGYDAFKHFTRDRAGIHLGGTLAADPLLNFDYVPYQEQNKTVKTGVGCLPEINGEHLVERIITPLAKWK